MPEVNKSRKSEELTAQIEAFDTFWEGPEDVKKGYKTLNIFYKYNYLKYLPDDKKVNSLVISCGPGYFVDMMNRQDYKNVLGIDSDPQKIKHAINRGLNCKIARAFEFLYENLNSGNKFDLIVAEQEINHLTKDELIDFLNLCKQNLNDNGTLIVHVINGANPIVGSESLAQNFDHYFTFTEYSLKQVLEYTKFNEIKIFPLNLYVFYSNPFNYIAMLVDKINTLFFRINFILYGKSNKIFTKKIAAACKK
jgi:2-polyprenyl-3-methyl-5-hydroxy-6-metoxy-1,4-benzoquinol methylase